ncbi:hypothetical protein ACUXQH_001847 [Staphylococcus hominis]|uniref:hypothetical protein n=1 Tax=Staphylococcus hominis TaxID=1290 RepID=UPI00119FD0D8|nr:hypothetical protein [Staphylococcus hominis]MBU5607080.1 hypothetical protein [Staphylococcus hominis]MDK7202518.1 hypothetical protein [Staphylococcus hominis]QIY37690.1 hypothetical protein FOC53_09495 [Staphylococcus hominis]
MSSSNYSAEREKEKKEKKVRDSKFNVLGIIVLIIIIIIVACVIEFILSKNLNNPSNKIDYISGDIYTGTSTFLTGILATIGICFTLYFNQKIKDKELYEAQKLKNQELLNELDQKSEWRKELMNIAAKPVMQLEDVYRILASLRFLPKSKDEIEGEESEKKEKQESTNEHQDEQESTNEHQEAQNEEQSNEEGKKVQKGTGNRKNGSDQKEFDVISNYIYKKLNMILNKILLGSITKKTYTKNFLKIPLSIKNSEEIRLYTKFLLKHHWEYNQGEKDKKKFKKKELEEFKKVMEEIHRLNQEDNIKKDYYKTDKIYTGDLEAYAKKLKTNSEDK